MVLVIAVTRAQALGFRAARHGLAGQPGGEVLALGVQDTGRDSAALALSVRGAWPPPDDAIFLWSVRGARHLHRGDDLELFAQALAVGDDADADARFGALGAGLRAEGGSSAEAVEAVAGEMRALLTDGACTKGDVSGALRGRVPDAWQHWCDGCGAHHLPDGVFKLAALRARVALEPEAGGRGRLLPPSRSSRTKWTVDAARAEVARRYSHLHGPARDGPLQRWLGTTPAAAAVFLSAVETVEVHVGGRAATVLDADLDDLLAAADAPQCVRLLAPYDPWLANGDRDLVVPEAERQRAVWRSLHPPGVVLDGVEVVGTWRARLAGRRLDVQVDGFGNLAARVRKALDAEAERVAEVRGCAGARVTA